MNDIDQNSRSAMADPEPSTDIEAIGVRPFNHRLGYRLTQIASIAVLLALWQFVGSVYLLMYISSPVAIAQAAWRMTLSGELLTALLESGQTLMLGFAIASVFAVLAGLVIGRYRLVEAAVDWIINALYSMPMVALIPLVVIWMGLGSTAKLFIVIMFTFFPVVINTVTGVRNVSKDLIDVGNAFAANERDIFLKIILPGSIPYVMTGLRLGIGRAFIGLVFAEFFTALSGLGGMILKYSSDFDTAAMLVPVLVLTIFGVLLISGVERIEEKFAPWKVTSAS